MYFWTLPCGIREWTFRASNYNGEHIPNPKVHLVLELGEGLRVGSKDRWLRPAVGVPLLVRAPTRTYNHPSFHAIPHNLKVKAQGSGKRQLCSSIPANVAHRTLKPTRGDEDFSKSAKLQADLPMPKPVESHTCPKSDLHLSPTIVPSGLQL